MKSQGILENIWQTITKSPRFLGILLHSLKRIIFAFKTEIFSTRDLIESFVKYLTDLTFTKLLSSALNLRLDSKILSSVFNVNTLLEFSQ